MRICCGKRLYRKTRDRVFEEYVRSGGICTGSIRAYDSYGCCTLVTGVFPGLIAYVVCVHDSYGRSGSRMKCTEKPTGKEADMCVRILKTREWLSDRVDIDRGYHPCQAFVC